MPISPEVSLINPFIVQFSICIASVAVTVISNILSIFAEADSGKSSRSIAVNSPLANIEFSNAVSFWIIELRTVFTNALFGINKTFKP